MDAFFRLQILQMLINQRGRGDDDEDDDEEDEDEEGEEELELLAQSAQFYSAERCGNSSYATSYR